MATCKIVLIAAIIALSTAAVVPAEDAESEVEPTSLPRFHYSYGVDEPSTGDSKNLTESRDGDVVTGSYNVVEPDGVVRTVKYTASDAEGFRAVVEKSGTPTPAPSPTPSPAPEVVLKTSVPVYPVYSVAAPPAIAAYSVPVYPPVTPVQRSSNDQGIVYSFSTPVSNSAPRVYPSSSYEQVPDVVAYSYVEPEPAIYSSFYRLPIISTISAYRYPEAPSMYQTRPGSSYVKFTSPDVSYSY